MQLWILTIPHFFKNLLDLVEFLQSRFLSIMPDSSPKVSCLLSNRLFTSSEMLGQLIVAQLTMKIAQGSKWKSCIWWGDDVEMCRDEMGC